MCQKGKVGWYEGSLDYSLAGGSDDGWVVEAASFSCFSL